MSHTDKEYRQKDKKMNDYKKLLGYYKKCLNLIDRFHFNSETAHTVYAKYVTLQSGKVIPITHAGIKDNREKKTFDKDTLHIGFIGNATPYKGLPLLISVLNEIDTTKWKLEIWGGSTGKDKKLPIYHKGKFSSKTTGDVYRSMDVLVVPSIWQETFSLVTLEALSYGVPVIASDNVGAKDIIKQYDKNFVYCNADELRNLLKRIIHDRRCLEDFNEKILQYEWSHSVMAHAQRIIREIYEK